MKLRGLFKGALLLTLASLMVAALAVVGLLGFIYYNSQGGQNWDALHGSSSPKPSPAKRETTPSPARSCWGRTAGPCC